jgi:predicted nucleic acid-binding Zn ribbon protein
MADEDPPAAADEPPVPPLGPPGDDAAAAAAAAALRRVSRSTGSAKRKRPRPKGPTYADGRDPQPLSVALDRLMAEQGWQDQSAVALLMAEWSQIVGPDLADHVTPVSFDEGELLLQAESTTWATQVRLLLPQVHRAVDERVGKGVVTAIRIQGPQAPSWGSGPRRVKGRGPRDTYG